MLFASRANNLALTRNDTPIPAPVDQPLNVFLRDRTNQMTTLVSVNLSGAGGGNDDSFPTGVSTNGRYAVFESRASDLVPGDTNGFSDIFVRDLAAGATLLVSVSTNGGSANGVSRSSVMTPNGRYVAFVSEANNLVPGDTNGIPDVFVCDLQAGTTTLVSSGATTTSGYVYRGEYWRNAGSSEAPDMTPDGRYVAFYSTATNLVPGGTTVGDIYVRDLVGGTTTWVSSYARTAAQAVMGTTNAVSFNHALSADGQFVAYEASPCAGSSYASAGLILRYDLLTGVTDLVNTNAYVPAAAPEDIRNLDLTPDGRFIAFVANTNGTSSATTCVYVWDADSGASILASGDLGNSVPTNSVSDFPCLVAGGRFVAFLSSAANLVTNPLAGTFHLYVRDTQEDTTALVDADTNAMGAGVGPETVPCISADGGLVAFACPDASLVPDDRNRALDVFMFDLTAGACELISARDPSLPALSPNGLSLLSAGAVSTDGRYVAFASDADNLVPNDTNGCRDIFVRDLLLGTNILVSAGTNGAAADGLSTEPVISGDGRYVAFTSFADNLVPGDTNKVSDVFVRDLQAGTTVLVSASMGGSGPGNKASYSPSISADGRFVLYHSQAQNLGPGSFPPSAENLFVRDLQLGTNYVLTQTGNGDAKPVGSMTADDRFVAFYGWVPPLSGPRLYLWDSQSASLVYTNVVTGTAPTALAISPDGNHIAYFGGSGPDIWAVDRVANTNWYLTYMPAQSQPGLRFSGDGRFLAYVSGYNPPLFTNRVYLYDFQTRSNIIVSQTYNPSARPDNAADSADISSDGRFVAYRSAAGNLVPGDTNGLPDVFLYDRVNGTTTLVSTDQSGYAPASDRSLAPFFSGDGQTLFFQSWASDLVDGGFGASGNVFAYNVYASGQIPLFSATIACGAGKGQGPQISWPAVPGRTHHVQFKNTLSDPAWQDFGGGVAILGSRGYLNDMTAGTGPRFYRVVAY